MRQRGAHLIDNKKKWRHAELLKDLLLLRRTVTVFGWAGLKSREHSLNPEGDVPQRVNHRKQLLSNVPLRLGSATHPQNSASFSVQTGVQASDYVVIPARPDYDG